MMHHDAPYPHDDVAPPRCCQDETDRWIREAEGGSGDDPSVAGNAQRVGSSATDSLQNGAPQDYELESRSLL